MSLKSVLNRLPDPFFSRGSFTQNSAFEVSCQRASVSLSEFEPKQPPDYLLMEEYRLALKAVAEPEIWGKLSKRSLRAFAWMLFSAPVSDVDRLMSIPGFWHGYYAELKRRQYGRGWLTVYYVLMLTYPSSQTGFETVRQALALSLSHTRDHRSVLINGQCEAFSLLKPNAPEALLNYLEDGEVLSALYLRAGLTGALATGRFTQECYLKYLELAQNLLASSEWQLATAKQLITESIQLNRELKYPSFRINLIDALLLPFEYAKPQDDTKVLIKNFILGYFKDPRVNNGSWHSVSDVAKRVFMSWMVENTLEDFFSLLDFVSRGDATADRHWRYRKAFWKAYLDIDVIDEAWLVLGPYALETSKHFLKGNVHYGEFMRGSGVNSRHSALIMRIGNLVITEWSHSGKYRIWLENSQYAPKFYQKAYSRNALVQMPYLEESHHGSDTGGWQGRLSDSIKSLTGIAVKYNNYMRV
jgi:hypothetical protein